MKIVFITHTSQRRGLSTMWDCNKILQWILHAPFAHGIVRRDWSTKHLTQFMIQKSLPRQIVSGQPKPHATHDPKIPAKTGRFRSTINLTQFITQKSLPKQIISGQRKPHATYNSLPLPKQVVPDQRKRHATYDAKISRNIWYSSLCQGTVPGQRIPHTIHDSNSLPKQDASGKRKIFTQHTIHTSFQNRSFLENEKPHAT